MTDNWICSTTGRPWMECDCGNCERGPITRILKGEPTMTNQDWDREAAKVRPDEGQIVFVAGGVAQFREGVFYTGMEDPRWMRPIQWEVEWWLPITWDLRNYEEKLAEAELKLQCQTFPSESEELAELRGKLAAAEREIERLHPFSDFPYERCGRCNSEVRPGASKCPTCCENTHLGKAEAENQRLREQVETLQNKIAGIEQRCSIPLGAESSPRNEQTVSANLSTIPQYKRDRCEWCAAGWILYDGFHYHDEHCDDGPRCTAPTEAERIAELEGKLVAAKADSERLDAMIEHRWRLVFMPDHKLAPWHVWKPGDPDREVVAVGHGDTPREAIDAARGKHD